MDYMKRFFLSFLVITLLFISAEKALAVFMEGSGSSVIYDNNVKSAELKAKESALKNAVRNLFSSSGDLSAPEVTDEFLKFITKYKIVSRSVSDNTVFYTVSADIDEIAMRNINYYISDATNSAVYYITGNTGLAQRSDLLKEAGSVLGRYKFTTMRNIDFLALSGDTPAQEEIINAFSSSGSQFLFIFDITPSITKNGEIFNCETEVIVNLFSREKKFPSMKVTGKALDESEALCIQEAFKTSVASASEYIRKNLISLPKNSATLTTYTIQASDFAKFADVKSFMDFLKRRDILKDYSIKTFSIDEAVFEAQTVFSRESLMNNLNELRDRYGYSVEIDKDTLFLNFSSGGQQ